MKDSRDSHTLSQQQIDRHVDACAWLRPTHIAIDCFMDWPEYFRMWVNSIRRYDIGIIHRLKWWGWEYPQDGAVSSTEYVNLTKQFISDNIAYFGDDDIFDACAEAAVGPYWGDTYGGGWERFYSPACGADFNNMLERMLTEFPQVFSGAGLNTIADHCSHTAGLFTYGWISTENAARHRWLTCDSYPESDYPTVALGLQARLNELESLHALAPDKGIFITEFGYHLSPIGDVEQNEAVRAMLSSVIDLPYLAGINYWVGCGYEKHTDIIYMDGNQWVPREAAKSVASFFANKGRFGRVPIS